MRVFIDTNVLADVFLKRQPYILESSNVLELCSDGIIQGFTSSISLSNLFFILKKVEGTIVTKKMLLGVIKIIRVLPVDEEIIAEALEGSFSDFEDEIQYHCALKNRIDYIITRDEKDFRKSNIPVLSPGKFLDMIDQK